MSLHGEGLSGNVALLELDEGMTAPEEVEALAGSLGGIDPRAQLNATEANIPLRSGDALLDRVFTAERPLTSAAPNRLSVRERIGRSKLGRFAVRTVASLAALSGAATAFALEAPAAHADAGVYQVYNTGGEDLALHPDSPTIDSAVSDRMPDNTTFDVNCFTMSDSVFGDRAWLYGTDETTGDTGYAADYYITTNDSPGNEAAGLQQAGIPECGSDSSSSSAGNTAANPQPQSVFYSPLKPSTGLPGLTVAQENLPIGTWSSSDCSPDEATDIPSSVDTLAGWSLGRLGPIYFLAASTPEQKANIHTIELFDPGDTENFSEGCDADYDINSLLASWLSSNSANRLIIYTGQVTEEGQAGIQSGSFDQQVDNGDLKRKFSFAGLWKYYLAGIWNQPFAGQALICDYAGMGHEAVLENFADTVQSPPNSYPTARDGQQPVSWNP